jgi:hypothetical protein
MVFLIGSELSFGRSEHRLQERLGGRRWLLMQLGQHFGVSRVKSNPASGAGEKDSGVSL